MWQPWIWFLFIVLDGHNGHQVSDYVKTELLPDYDYEEFDRREEEYNRNRAEGMNTQFDDEGDGPAEDNDADSGPTDIEVETESLSTRWEE